MKQIEKTRITIKRIVDAGIAEFGKNGYKGGTVNHICDTGISKGLIYHNFKDKDGLYLECLRYSIGKLTEYLEDKRDTLEIFMSARREFFKMNPDEAHIIFEALLSPPSHMTDDIRDVLKPFNDLNDMMYSMTLENITLRDGVSRKDAEKYFHMMQMMLNGYFSSPSSDNVNMSDMVDEHEIIVSKLLDYMLYGIAKGER